MRDNLLALLTGWGTVAFAKVLGTAWIGDGVKALFLGLMGSAGGYIAKLLLDYTIRKIKNKKSKSKHERI